MVSAVNLTSGSVSTSGSSAATASVSPDPNKLQLLPVVSRSFTGVAPPVPSVSGCGLTWVQVATLQYDTAPTSLKRVTLFRSMGASPSSGVLTIDFAGESQTDICWSLDQLSGVPITGTHGSGAIVQSATAKDESGSALSITATLAAFANAANATYGAFAHVAPTNGYAANEGSGFTKLSGPVSSLIGLVSQFKSTNDTSVDGTLTGVAYELGMIAVEIAGVTLRRALTASSGQIRQVTSAELGTGIKPLVLMADGSLKLRATTEGTPLVFVAGVLRTLGAGEALEI